VVIFIAAHCDVKPDAAMQNWNPEKYDASCIPFIGK
jgi:hypothetical protein